MAIRLYSYVCVILRHPPIGGLSVSVAAILAQWNFSPIFFRTSAGLCRRAPLSSRRPKDRFMTRVRKIGWRSHRVGRTERDIGSVMASSETTANQIQDANPAHVYTSLQTVQVWEAFRICMFIKSGNFFFFFSSFGFFSFSENKFWVILRHLWGCFFLGV